MPCCAITSLGEPASPELTTQLLIPADKSQMFGRDGILAHSYLMGPSGQSNGCVSFNDYPAFLDAFLSGDVNRLVVVERLTEPPSPVTASDWIKDLFRRS